MTETEKRIDEAAGITEFYQRFYYLESEEGVTNVASRIFAMAFLTLYLQTRLGLTDAFNMGWWCKVPGIIHSGLHCIGYDDDTAFVEDYMDLRSDIDHAVVQIMKDLFPFVTGGLLPDDANQEELFEFLGVLPSAAAKQLAEIFLREVWYYEYPSVLVLQMPEWYGKLRRMDLCETYRAVLAATDEMLNTGAFYYDNPLSGTLDVDGVTYLYTIFADWSDEWSSPADVYFPFLFQIVTLRCMAEELGVLQQDGKK